MAAAASHPQLGSRPTSPSSPFALLGRLETRALAPVDAASLGAFRFLLGSLVVIATIRHWLKGGIRDAFVVPTHFFAYDGLSFVRPLPGAGMYVVYGARALAAASLVCLRPEVLGCAHELPRSGAASAHSSRSRRARSSRSWTSFDRVPARTRFDSMPPARHRTCCVVCGRAHGRRRMARSRFPRSRTGSRLASAFPRVAKWCSRAAARDRRRHALARRRRCDAGYSLHEGR